MVLLMNRGLYDGLSDQKKAWIDAVATMEMSLNGARVFDAMAQKAFDIARESGVEIVEIDPEARAGFQAAIAPAMADVRARPLAGQTEGDIIDLMKGK